jgi:hypothetical protein
VGFLDNPGQVEGDLSPFTQAVAKKVIEIGDFVYFVAGFLPVVFHPAKLDDVVFEDNVARPPVPISRLSYRADVT